MWVPCTSAYIVVFKCCCIPGQDTAVSFDYASSSQSQSVHLGRHSMVLQSTDHQFLVQTSFSKCAWSLQMFRLGSAKEAAIGESVVNVRTVCTFQLA